MKAKLIIKQFSTNTNTNRVNTFQLLLTNDISSQGFIITRFTSFIFYTPCE